jgi:hypothetical protein
MFRMKPGDTVFRARHKLTAIVWKDKHNVNILMMFAVKALRGIVGRNQCFGDGCCLHFEGLSDVRGTNQ